MKKEKITNNEIFALIIVLIICQAFLLICLFSPDIGGITGLIVGSGITERTVKNDAPLLTAIPDQEWEQDNSITIELYDYFSDPENIPLKFSNSPVTDMIISIDPVSGSAKIVPYPGWNGMKYIVFYASDGPNQITSNNLTLIVNQVLTAKPIVPSEENRGVSGCKYRWECNPWTKCLEGDVQERSCINSGNCPESYNPPVTTRACTYRKVPAVAQPQPLMPTEEKHEAEAWEEMPGAIIQEVEEEPARRLSDIFDISYILLLVAILLIVSMLLMIADNFGYVERAKEYFKRYPKTQSMSRIVSRKKAAVILADVPEEKAFIVKDDQVAWNLNQMHAILLRMDSVTFSNHVLEERNDFADWIRDVAKDNVLALELRKAKIRSAGSFAAVIKKRIILLHKILR